MMIALESTPKLFETRCGNFYIQRMATQKSLCKFNLFPILVKEFEFGDTYGGVF
jgi:hypothetical protein